MNHRIVTKWVAIVYALAILGASVFPLHHANASDPELAKALKSASENELRAEFRRRFQGRIRAPQTLQADRIARSAPSALSKVTNGALIRESRARMIWGPDTRTDWYGVSDPALRSLAKASVALVDANSVSPAGNNMLRLKTRPLKNAKNLCSGQPFEDQPSEAAFCSGTLIAPDQVLTAGHCVRIASSETDGRYLKEIDFVFGYRLESKTGDPTLIPASQVFTGGRVLRRIENHGTDYWDWAVLQLSTKVPPSVAEPVTNWNLGPVRQAQRVFVIGFPDGMPLKYVPGATVLDPSNSKYFLATVSTFAGNSGSGIYDEASKSLVGIFYGGSTDYEPDSESNSCNVATQCYGSDCPGDPGEYVTRISLVKHP